MNALKLAALRTEEPTMRMVSKGVVYDTEDAIEICRSGAVMAFIHGGYTSPYIQTLWKGKGSGKFFTTTEWRVGKVARFFGIRGHDFLTPCIDEYAARFADECGVADLAAVGLRLQRA